MGTPRSHRAPCAVFLGADPWSIPLELFTILASAPQDIVRNGPGISQRAAAARSQTVWRWLVRFHRESERVRS